MPSRINDARPTAALIKRFHLQGDYRPQMDETVVPVVLVGDLDEPEVPTSFGTPPGPDLAMRGWGLVMAGGVSSQALLIRAGAAPLNLERILVWGNAATLIGVFQGRQLGGTIVIGGGAWGARRQGQPSATFEVVTLAPGQPLPANQLLAVIPCGSFEVSGDWCELGISLQQGAIPMPVGAVEPLSIITLVPLSEFTPNFPTVVDGNGLVTISAQWRE